MELGTKNIVTYMRKIGKLRLARFFQLITSFLKQINCG